MRGPQQPSLMTKSQRAKIAKSLATGKGYLAAMRTGDNFDGKVQETIASTLLTNLSKVTILQWITCSTLQGAMVGKYEPGLAAHMYVVFFHEQGNPHVRHYHSK